MQEITERLQRIEEGLDQLREYLVGVDTKNAARRKEYRAAKAKRDEGKVPLPDRHVLRYRDKRIQHRVRAWAEAGMRFGHANQPEKFCAWFVYEWNNTCYLKKPVTFSGSSFRVWVDHLRCSYGPLDLMGYAKRRDRVQVLRNDGEYDDFQKRPWWDWSYAVFKPVISEMQEVGFDELPEPSARRVSEPNVRWSRVGTQQQSPNRSYRQASASRCGWPRSCRPLPPVAMNSPNSVRTPTLNSIG